MILSGTNVAGTDSGVTNLSNLLLSTGLFTKVLDTGSGATKVVHLKYRSALHLLKIQANSTYIRFEALNLAGTAISGYAYNLNPASVYKIIYSATGTIAVVFDGTTILIGTIILGIDYIMYNWNSSGNIRWFDDLNDTPKSGPTAAPYPTYRTTTGKEIIGPVYLINDSNQYSETALTDIFIFPNITPFPMGASVTINTVEYLVVRGFSTPNNLIVRNG